ncbi:MAG: BolA family protein, partial [Nitrospinia bacterium]
MDTTEIIDNNLREKIAAEHVEIIDESHLHRGHKAAGGGGHYSIIVVSPQFENLNVMERIRLVHKALDHEMTGTPKLIHALQVKTFDNT